MCIFNYNNLNFRIMMNMKKLIDQTDFDNLSQLSKRWSSINNQKSIPPQQKQTQKQNDFKKSNEISLKGSMDQKSQENSQIIASSSMNTKNSQPNFSTLVQKKNKIVPQVIDQDTEHFKNKLEHLLNNFKTDAVSQFMNMKREMLDYQQECVKSDTHKYLTMYEQKHKQLLETKQKLLQISRQAEKKNQQVQHLSDHIAKLNQRIKIFRYTSRPFSVLYENMIKEKQLKFKMKEAAKFDQRRLKRKSIWGWAGVYKNEKSEKQKIQNQKRIQNEVNQIVGKFQKQMDMLKQRLAQATRKNQQHQNSKHLLQDNLKKAFLRGVCAMNMQAMGVLGTQNAEQHQWMSQKDYSSRQKINFANNLSYIDPKPSPSLQTAQNHSMFVCNSSQNSRQPQSFSQNYQSDDKIIVQPQKSQSKNNKWKQAPIMGVEQMREEQEPRMQVVRPTTQGKVIKVVEGKSTVEGKDVRKIGIDKGPINGSRKKI